MSDLNAKVATLADGLHRGLEWALEQEAVIRPLADRLRLTEATVQGAAAPLGLDRVAICRLVRRYRQRPQTSSLLPRRCGRDRKGRFLEQSREDLIVACIKELYLVPEQPSMAALLGIAPNRVVWGSSKVWGSSGMTGFSVVWGSTTDAADSVVWGTALTSNDAAMAAIYGDLK